MVRGTDVSTSSAYTCVCLRRGVRAAKRRLSNAVAATRKIHSFFVTTTAGDDETSEGNPGNSNGNSVDVAPPVPEPEIEVAAESVAAEPAPRVPVVQELDLTLDNPTDRALFQLSILPSELRSGNLHHCPCRPKGSFAISSENGKRRISSGGKPVPSTFWGYGNRTAMALLLTNDEEVMSPKLLVVRRSIGNAKRVDQQPQELRSEDHIRRENPSAP